MERKLGIVNKCFCFFNLNRLCIQMLTAYRQGNPENEEQLNSRILNHNLIVNVVRIVRRELAV